MQFTGLSKKNRKVVKSKLASRLGMESLESRVLLDGALPAAARSLLVNEPPGQLELQRLDAEATLSGIDTLTALPGARQATHTLRGSRRESHRHRAFRGATGGGTWALQQLRPGPCRNRSCC